MKLSADHAALILHTLLTAIDASGHDDHQGRINKARAGWVLAKNAPEVEGRADFLAAFEALGKQAIAIQAHEDEHGPEGYYPDEDIERMRVAEQEAEDAYDRDVAMGLEPPRGWD